MQRGDRLLSAKKPIRLIITFSILLYILSQNSTIFAENLAPGPSRVITSEAVTPPEAVAAPAAILMDAKTGNIFFERNADEKMYPASMTKVMTALLVLEHPGIDFGEVLTVPQDALDSLEWDSSIMGLKAGEVVTINELMYGLLLPSGNDAALVLGEYISGNVKDFAALMTKRAAELGAVSTNFVNPHGLHDENHYTTAHDMALIMKEAIKYPKFKEIISATNFMLPPSNKRETETEIKNTNKLIISGEYYNPDVYGGKTGYTDEAKHTLACYAKRGEIELVAVVMGDEKNMTYTDSTLLFDYCFDNYEYRRVINSNYETDIELYSGETKNGVAVLRPAENIMILLPKDVTDDELVTIADTSGFTGETIAYGDRAGTITVSYDSKIIAQSELVSVSDVYKKLPEKGKKTDEQEDPAFVPVFSENSEGEKDKQGFFEAYGKHAVTFGVIAFIVAAFLFTRALIISERRRREFLSRKQRRLNRTVR